jgi:ATP-dependent Clp protease adaptor protein ClpS
MTPKKVRPTHGHRQCTPVALNVSPSVEVLRSSAMSATSPMEVLNPDTGIDEATDTPWVVIVWNDPINLMSYVTHVLRKLFGYSKEKATRLMMQVHNEGKAVVSSGSRAEAERDVFRLHEHGLWATMQQD